MDKGKGKSKGAGGSGDDDTCRTSGKGGDNTQQAVNDSHGAEGQGGARPGLLSSIAQSAQSHVTPQALSSMLAANGKAPAQFAPGESAASAPVLQDLRHAHETGESSVLQRGGAFSSGPTTFRQQGLHALEGSTAPQQDSAYRTFADPQGSLPPLTGELRTRRGNGAHVGPYRTSAHLDRPLHEEMRGMHPGNLAGVWQRSEEEDFGMAWDDAQAATNTESLKLVDPAYHDAWTRAIPAPTFSNVNADRDALRGDTFDLMHHSAINDGVQNDADFMAALSAEEAEEQAQRPGPDRSSNTSQSLPGGLSAQWSPPSPSREPTLTAEQYVLHRALADEQDHGRLADEERVRPPDDDEAARTGVYAATPEDALQAIWTGSEEGKRASSVTREAAQVRALNVGGEEEGALAQGFRRRLVQRVLARGSYVDDVYGLPPALEATIRQAEAPETEDNRALRAKAVARLEALYKHLGAAAPEDRRAQTSHFVRDW